jgi:ribosomal protein S18 acetylase RimI-like enzyme
MGKVTIRKATLSDIPVLLKFEQGVIQTERPFDTTLKDDTHYYDLEALIHSPESELLVAELDSTIIGSGYARIEKAKHYLKHPLHAYLGFMYVDPAHRGKGINKIIIEALAEWTKTKNITEMRLDVYCNNEMAIKAYEKVGFGKHMVSMRRGL